MGSTTPAVLPIVIVFDIAIPPKTEQVDEEDVGCPMGGSGADADPIIGKEFTLDNIGVGVVDPPVVVLLAVAVADEEDEEDRV